MRKTYFCQRLARKQMKPFSFVLIAQYNCKLFVHNAMSESDILWFMPFEPYRYDTTEQSTRRIYRRSDPPDIASAVAVAKEQMCIRDRSWTSPCPFAAPSVNCTPTTPVCPAAVSYTHLDVYKRQPLYCVHGVSPDEMKPADCSMPVCVCTCWSPSRLPSV